MLTWVGVRDQLFFLAFLLYVHVGAWGGGVLHPFAWLVTPWGLLQERLSQRPCDCGGQDQPREGRPWH